MTAPASPPVPEAAWAALRVAVWMGLNLAGLVGGGAAGLALTPRVDAHNDWGATGLLFIACGAVAGSSVVVAGLAIWAGAAGGRRGSPLVTLPGEAGPSEPPR